MKKILPLLFVLLAFVSKAQIINFTDANFKNALLNYHPGLDANTDGEIDATEALTLTNIYVESSEITDLTGIEYFTNVRNLDIADNSLTSFPTIPSFVILDTLNCSQNLFTSLDVSSLVNLSYLDCGNNQLSTLNINGLSQLRYFWCGGNQLTTLDLSGSPNLLSACVNNNNISNLNLTGCNSLQYLLCQYNNLSAINTVEIPNLQFLECQNNHLSTLNLAGFIHLNYLYCVENQLTSINVANCTSLQNFQCYNNQLTSLDLSQHLDSLSTFGCNTNLLTVLDVTHCPLLTNLSCGSNQLTTLDVSYCPLLTGLSCYNNQLADLDVSNLHVLYSLQCSGNLLTTLDVSSCPNLSQLYANSNNLLSADLKNGPTIISLIMLDPNPNLQFVCTDEAEINSLSDYFTQHGMANVNVNSYCSFTPGGQYFTATGTVKIDIDNNGCSVSDPAINLLKVKIDDGTQQGYTSTNAVGSYHFYTNAGNFTIRPEFPNPYYNVNPSSISIPLNSGTPAQLADFCISANGIHPDLEITLISLTPARPGFNAIYQLVYKNKGNQSLSGNVQLNFDDTRLDLINATPAVSSQTTGSLSWVYASLLPFESRSINLTFNILPPPLNNINDNLVFTAQVNPIVADETPADNSFSLNQIISGSFDPNDKTCLEGKFIDITNIGEYVHYVIRFQNTGNDTAFNVVVKDMLSDKYDWNSLEIIKTSHPCVLRQTQGNKIEFIFQDIKLPAQSVNDAGSNGFVSFKIKPTVNFSDSLINSAAIFFDFNFPVITNDAISIIDSVNLLPVNFEYFKGQKQEAKNMLTWKANCNGPGVTFQIERSTDNRNFTSIGNIAASHSRCQLPFDFIDDDPANNINYYHIKMTDADGKISISNIVALINRKTGFEIISMAPNPVISKTAFLNVTSAQSQQINIMITDVNGRSVYAIAQTITAGSSQIEMNLNTLSKGIYNINVNTSEGGRRSLRFVKQ